MRRLLTALLVLLAAGPVAAQTTTYSADKITVGATTFGAGPLRVVGLPTGAGTNCVAVDGNGDLTKTASACATVTSVGLSAPAELNVGGSPVTTSGTLALTWANVAANSVFQRGAGSGVPSFSTSLSLGGTLGVTGNATIGDASYLSRSTYASQTTGWRIDAAGAADFRYLYTDELHTKVFFADLEQALAGSQIISKSVAIVHSAFTCPRSLFTSQLIVRDLPSGAGTAVFANDDWIVMRTFSRSGLSMTVTECVGIVTLDTTYGTGGLLAASGSTPATQAYTFTRGNGAVGCSGAAGSNGAADSNVPAESLALDFGVSGNGYAEVNAIDGVGAVNSPYYQVVTWTTCPTSGNRVRQAKWGNLNGTYGYSSAAYGFAAGPETGANVTVDPTNGIRFRNGTAVLGSWVGDTVTLGQPLTANNTGQIVIDSNSLDINWRNNSGSTSTVFKVDNSSGSARIVANGWNLGASTLAGSVDGSRSIVVSGSGNTLTLFANGAGAELIARVDGGSTGLRPYADNVMPLGLSTHNWAAVYATRYYSGSTAGVVSGTCSAVTVTGGIVTGCTP